MNPFLLHAVLALPFALATPSVLLSEDIPASKEDFPSKEVEQLVQDGIQAQKCPGAVVTVGFRGKTVYQAAFGSRELEPQRKPMSVDTIFDLASLTKPIATATSVMILADEGKLSLTDPVSKYLPDFAVHEKESVTVEHLLLHTSGLIPDNGMSDYRGTHAESIANLLSQELRSPPGTRFRYSDVGFLVLGELVHQVSGMPLDQFAQKRIFEPLQMNDTGFRSIGGNDDRCATTQQREGHWMRGEVHDPRAYALGGVAGHAGLFSTADDLSRFANAMVNGGPTDDRPLFSKSTFDAMTSPVEVPGKLPSQIQWRSRGWDKRSAYSSNRGKSMTDAAFGHGGFTGTALWIDPELKLSVIFLSNRVHPNGKGSVNSLAGEIGTIAADWAAQQLSTPEDSTASDPVESEQ
ncbi:serine hydrolase domain-containing protein [Rhodopirellula sp. P2]|uniref:serine hydrolase domain-containing protein n=1 Tax=Rhodopirellula sp. P2 TaxID=2127060 RepID=UPI002367A6E5|nr:serine hydrolase domain-containing protein [Rhodopirellula sp. P2]WDQ15924.1 serine hydrolase [Rhodopirellula sp. P2]